jgi:hypothetical protein
MGEDEVIVSSLGSAPRGRVFTRQRLLRGDLVHCLLDGYQSKLRR